MEINIWIPNEEKTILFGELIGKKLIAPSLIYLSGELGAGKTHVSKGIAKGIGIEEDITSPTFTLINEYKTPNIELYHLDLYRLNSLGQILDLGIEDFIDTPKSICLIEWPEKLYDYEISENILKIKIEHQTKGRDFTIMSDNEKFFNLLEELKEVANTWN